MKNILKIALILTLVTAISAGVLAWVNSNTTKVIEAREEEELLAMLEEFFPQATGADVEEIDGDKFTVAKDDNDNVVGVLVEARTRQGYAGDIRYRLVINSEGEIIGIDITEHSETPGLGAKIDEDPYKNSIIGLTVEDPIKAGTDVDMIGGATVSADAVANSVRATMDKFGANFLGQ